MTAPRVDEQLPAAPSMDRNDLRLSPLALSHGPSQNKVITSYEEWLISARSSVSSRTAVRGPTDEIIASLEEEFRRLQIKKASEWKRQQEVTRCNERVGALGATMLKPNDCIVVDTCESAHFLYPFLFSHRFKLHSSLATPCPYTIPSLRVTSWRQPFTCCAVFPLMTAPSSSHALSSSSG